MTDMDRGARAWLIVVAVDNFWRVAKWYELPDLIQDGYMVWARVVKKYEVDAGRVRSRPHLMRLFKTAYLNHINDLSNAKTRALLEVLVGDLVGDVDDPWDVVGAICPDAEMQSCIAEAPAIIGRVLSRLITCDGRALRSLHRVAADGTRGTLNSRLCRMAGVDPDIDLVGELRAYFKAAV